MNKICYKFNCIYLSIIAVTVAIICFIPISYGEYDPHILNISGEANPAEIVGPDTIDLTFTISNSSEYDIEDIYISSSDGLTIDIVGDVPSGETLTVTREHSVTSNELDGGVINYTFSHRDVNDGEVTINYSVQIPIYIANITPEYEFTRSFSSTSICSGNDVVAVYTVRNTGNIALKDVRIGDVLGDFSGRTDTINPGEAEYFVNRVTVDQDVISRATFNCTTDFEGYESLEAGLEEVTITAVNAGITASLTVNQSNFEEGLVDLIIVLENAGQEDIFDITITDIDNGGVISDSIDLPAGGQPVTITHQMLLKENVRMSCRIDGRTDEYAVVTAVSNAVSVAPEFEQDSSGLEISVIPSTETINHQGYVRFNVNIKNNDDRTAKVIMLSEKTAGSLCEYTAIPAGGSIVDDFLLYVEFPGEFIFTATDLSGNTATAAVGIEISSEGADPERETGEGKLSFSDTSIVIGGQSIYLIMIIGIVVILTVLSSLLFIKSLEGKKLRRQRQEVKKSRAASKEELNKDGGAQAHNEESNINKDALSNKKHKFRRRIRSISRRKKDGV